MGAKRLVCVVEGRGEVRALPALCSMIRDHLAAWTWVVDDEPVRQPRSSLVDESIASPKRPGNASGLYRAVTLAKLRPADAVLVLCDSDDDCPVVWAQSGQPIVDSISKGACVMAVREYEAWLLASQLGSTTDGTRKIDGIRDAKGALARHWPGYKPSVHQLAATRKIDVPRLRALSPSFDKLVRSLAKIFGAPAKVRAR
jgi:hypothetical protein